MGLKKLANGSVLVENMGPKSIGIINEQDIKTKLPDESLHGLIYYEEKEKNKIEHRIIHAQTGGVQEGVKSLPISRAISPLKRNLGDVYVLRPKQKNIQSNLTKVATKWDPKLTREQAEKLPKARGSVILPTPFEKRGPEDQKDAYHYSHSLYRAFTAYKRSHTSYKEPHTKSKLKAQPISKNKGICCSDFIGYSYKVSLIESNFPSGLPKSILKAMKNIEAYKKKHESKLEDVPENLLEEFVKAVMKYFPNENVNFRKLCTPVRGMGIEFFSENAFERQDDWEFEGYLCYKLIGPDEEGNPMYEPYVIDHETYTKLSANQNSDKGVHGIIISEAEIKALEKEKKDTLTIKT